MSITTWENPSFTFYTSIHIFHLSIFFHVDVHIHSYSSSAKTWENPSFTFYIPTYVFFHIHIYIKSHSFHIHVHSCALSATTWGNPPLLSFDIKLYFLLYSFHSWYHPFVIHLSYIYTSIYFFIHSEETHRDSACTYQLTFSFIFNFKYFPRNTHSWFICHVYKDKSVVFHIYIHFLYIHTYVLTIFSRHKIHVRRQRGPKNLKGKSHHDSTNRVTLLLRPYSRPLPRALGRSWGGGGLLWARYPCIICRVWCIAACTALPRYKLNVRPSPLSIAGDAIHREIERSRPFF